LKALLKELTMQQKLLESLIEGFAWSLGAALCALLVKEFGLETEDVTD
jgi:hypothetical protein